MCPDGACWPWPMISSTWLRTPSSEIPSDFQGLRRYTFAFVNKTQQDVLGADVVVVEHPGLFLRQDDDPAGTVGKSFEHRWLPALPHHRYPVIVDTGADGCVPAVHCNGRPAGVPNLVACPSEPLEPIQHQPEPNPWATLGNNP